MGLSFHCREHGFNPRELRFCRLCSEAKKKKKKTTIKFIWKGKGPHTTKTTLKKN